jgi:CubicO group peptidase (beta-lactamase class C family)
MSLMPNAEFGNRADTLAADIPAGGKTSARATARMYAALLGQVDGVRLISSARLREATTVAFSGIDQVFGMPTTWALGFSIGRPGAMESSSAFGVGGVGGSFAYGDASTGIAFAMTKRRLTQDFNAAAQLTQLVTDALK